MVPKSIPALISRVARRRSHLAIAQRVHQHTWTNDVKTTSTPSRAANSPRKATLARHPGDRERRLNNHRARSERYQRPVSDSSKPLDSVSPNALRLACQCSRCVDPSDGQKTFSVAQVPVNISVKDSTLLPDGNFEIRWQNDVPGFDENHVSVFEPLRMSTFSPLQGDYDIPLSKRPVDMWTASSFDIESNTVAYADYMTDDTAFAKALSDLWSTGLIFVKDVPSDPDSVQRLAERIALLRNTFYGPTWDVRSKPNAENIAYTSRYLGYHMDLLYMREPPGLQLLHCIENTCQGGESFFADTFTALHQAEMEHASTITNLSKKRLRYAYHTGGQMYADMKSVVQKRSGTTRAIRYKTYQGCDVDGGEPIHLVDRVYWSPPFVSSHVHGWPNALIPGSPQQISSESNQRSLVAFDRKLESSGLRVETKLPAGTCVIFDNLRIVHARKAFDTNSGHRWLRGAYLDWQDFLNKASSCMHLMPAVKHVPDTNIPELGSSQYMHRWDKEHSTLDMLRSPFRRSPEHVKSLSELLTDEDVGRLIERIRRQEANSSTPPV